MPTERKPFKFSLKTTEPSACAPSPRPNSSNAKLLRRGRGGKGELTLRSGLGYLSSLECHWLPGLHCRTGPRATEPLHKQQTTVMGCILQKLELRWNLEIKVLEIEEGKKQIGQRKRWNAKATRQSLGPSAGRSGVWEAFILLIPRCYQMSSEAGAPGRAWPRATSSLSSCCPGGPSRSWEASTRLSAHLPPPNCQQALPSEETGVAHLCG